MPNFTLIRLTKTRDKDPTLTAVLLRRFLRDIDNRFNQLIQEIKKRIEDQNVLEGKPEPEIRQPLNPLIMAAQRYVYERSSDKAKEFMIWLDARVSDLLLTVEQRPGSFIPITGSLSEFWADTYIQSAYQSGIAQARNDLLSIGVQLPELGPISVSFNRPFHADRVGLVFTRVFNEMKGVTEQMKGQMSRVLATGMAEGRNPEYVSKMLNDRVGKLGRTRYRLIARTEMIQAHNEASLNEYNSLEGIVGEEIKVQWWTAKDERVRGRPGGMYPDARPSHWARHGKIYEREAARKLLGAPNCRCALLPWVQTIADVLDKHKNEG